MNSKILLVLCFIGFIALISAIEESKSPVKYIHMEHSALPDFESSDVPHERVRRQWGYGMGYPMMGMYRPYGMGYGMGMYRPYGMMGMYRRPYGMYRPYGMWG
uniref:Uncharacterized protein n=1 Tax=Panagrolaimus superbus TaxID=310955 RepID=A0A914Y3Z9_9BILA